MQLTGSEVRFFAKTNNKPPNKSEIEDAEARGDRLVFIPDTMAIFQLRGDRFRTPKLKPTSVRNIFELFADPTEAKNASFAWNSAWKDISKRRIIKTDDDKEALEERRLRLDNATAEYMEIQKNFQGFLNFGGLLEFIDSIEENINGGWFFIKEHYNDELLDPETLASKLGYRVPSLTELFLIGLIQLGVDNNFPGWVWYPTDKKTCIPVVEPRAKPKEYVGETDTSNVPGRFYITISGE